MRCLICRTTRVKSGIIDTLWIKSLNVRISFTFNDAFSFVCFGDFHWSIFVHQKHYWQNERIRKIVS